MDAYGHATTLQEGNGVTVYRGYDPFTGLQTSTHAVNGANTTVAHLTTTWDGFGNLTSRHDAKNGSDETASYDELNRLGATTLSLAGGASRSLTFAYDALGNRTEKCDAGSCTAYAYGENGAGPHAVSSSSEGGAYAYDANGEMTQDGGKALSWAAFGKATSIAGAGSTVAFAYGPERARIEKTVTGAASETVLYLQGAEKLSVDGAASIRRTLVFAGVTITDTGGAQAGLLYAVRDHLGSTMALSDASGQVTQEMAYSPFGMRRTAGWASAMGMAAALAINTTETDRGYTGQESLDAVQLLDYNARLYDPALGRFLSVDPLIAHPGST